MIGTGWIADRFVSALRKHSSQQVVAVGSRTASSARSFAARHEVPVGYASYEERVADRDVDVVYIATPHNAHLPVALLALAAGKHTLVEKPIGATADEARQIADAARAAGRFCMEAMWTAFLPKFDVIRQLLESGPWASHSAWWPTSVSGSPTTTGSCGRSWRAARCWTWAPTWWRSRSTCWIRPTTWSPAASGCPAATLVIDGPFYQPGGFAITDGTGVRAGSLKSDLEKSRARSLRWKVRFFR